MSGTDLPKMWVDDEVDPITGEIYDNTSKMMPAVVEEEEKPLPSIAEQLDMVSHYEGETADEEMLKGVVEMNKVAQMLMELRTKESEEIRRTVVQSYCETFINSRMKNNVVAETLKRKLLERLLINLDNLDLETAARIYIDISDVTGVEAQQALAQIMGGTGGNSAPQQGNIQLTINNASTDGASITSNTLNVNPQQVGQLKEVNTLNSSIKAWNNMPLPKKKVIDTEYIENKKD